MEQIPYIVFESEMAHKLREMMRETTDDGLKAEIRRLAEKMESM